LPDVFVGPVKEVGVLVELVFEEGAAEGFLQGRVDVERAAAQYVGCLPEVEFELGDGDR
jgi:hypothetical protein